MDTILIRDLRVEVLIGIHKRERHVAQVVSIDLDIGLPGMNGYDVARAMRRMPELGSPCLVAVTGWGAPEDRRRAVPLQCPVSRTVSP